jgi:hypothetical protein
MNGTVTPPDDRQLDNREFLRAWLLRPARDVVGLIAGLALGLVGTRLVLVAADNAGWAHGVLFAACLALAIGGHARAALPGATIGALVVALAEVPPRMSPTMAGYGFTGITIAMDALEPAVLLGLGALIVTFVRAFFDDPRHATQALLVILGLVILAAEVAFVRAATAGPPNEGPLPAGPEPEGMVSSFAAGVTPKEGGTPMRTFRPNGTCATRTALIACGRVHPAAGVSDAPAFVRS